jgi:hypothetical protein
MRQRHYFYQNILKNSSGSQSSTRVPGKGHRFAVSRISNVAPHIKHNLIACHWNLLPQHPHMGLGIIAPPKPRNHSVLQIRQQSHQAPGMELVKVGHKTPPDGLMNLQSRALATAPGVSLPSPYRTSVWVKQFRMVLTFERFSLVFHSAWADTAYSTDQGKFVPPDRAANPSTPNAANP